MNKIKKLKIALLSSGGLIVLSVILGFGMLAVAYTDYGAPKVVVEGDYIEAPALSDEDIELGAFPGPDIYEKIRFHDGIIGNTTFQTNLNFQAGTSTTGVILEGTELLVGYMRNDTGGDLLCTDVWLDISTANGIFAYSLKVGTSTSATSTDGHLIADTLIATTTTDILSKEDDEGTSSTEVWDWDENEYMVVTETFQIVNATSAASFTAHGGNIGVGTLNANCWYRNN